MTLYVDDCRRWGSVPRTLFFTWWFVHFSYPNSLQLLFLFVAFLTFGAGIGDPRDVWYVYVHNVWHGIIIPSTPLALWSFLFFCFFSSRYPSELSTVPSRRLKRGQFAEKTWPTTELNVRGLGTEGLALFEYEYHHVQYVNSTISIGVILCCICRCMSLQVLALLKSRTERHSPTTRLPKLQVHSHPHEWATWSACGNKSNFLAWLTSYM